jgi:hypothetical protein
MTESGAARLDGLPGNVATVLSAFLASARDVLSDTFGPLRATAATLFELEGRRARMRARGVRTAARSYQHKRDASVRGGRRRWWADWLHAIGR